MKTQVLESAQAAAEFAAQSIATACSGAVQARGRSCIAVSGGQTPWLMLKVLAGLNLSWRDIHVFQVDERVAPAADASRNSLHISEILVRPTALPAANFHIMPVEAADLDGACQEYAQTISTLCGAPPVFDLVHLGLGTDGHTASLTPGDPLLGEKTRLVGMARKYQGQRRMSLTYPAINSARQILWLATGASKAQRVAELQQGAGGTPAIGIERANAIIVADREACATG